MINRRIHILGGGTFSHIRSHLALAAPAFGSTARQLYTLMQQKLSVQPSEDTQCVLTLTAMAGGTVSTFPTSAPELALRPIVTNEDVSTYVDSVIADPTAKVVIFNVALCDFTGQIADITSGKYATRLHSRDTSQSIDLAMAEKLVGKIRKHRKDIFLVAFKTTTGALPDAQYAAGLNLLKENSCNLVLANDTKTRLNMIIVPEEARYCVTTDRVKVLRTLVDMIYARSQLTFTRSTVVDGESVDWNGSEVPTSLREVVNHCIKMGAYKPFRGVTAGHFAFKQDDTTFITSKRKTNFNHLDTVGLVKVVSTSPDSVIAYGAKPSVGGQSQRIIFSEHDDVDCIVHFHCPVKDGVDISTRPQQWVECGSHQCGQNTSDGLQDYDGIKAVYLDQHGPNVVFNRDIDPRKVISFIDHHFTLSAKTGGLV